MNLSLKKTDLTRFFVVKPKDPGRRKKADLSGKTLGGSPGHMRNNTYCRNLKRTFEDLLPCLFLRNKDQEKNNQLASFFRNLPTQAKGRTWANCAKRLEQGFPTCGTRTSSAWVPKLGYMYP